MKKKFIHPDKLWDSSPSFFSQVVTVRGGKTVYVAGQVAFDEQKNLVGAGDLRAQAEQVCKNLVEALDTANATPEDVVKIVVYVKDYKSEYLPILNETVYALFKKNRYPTKTLLGVQALAREELLIEVEAVAVIE